MRLTSGLWFSYPGYNETLSGAADPRVDSNDKVPNPNVTVLEWLNGRPGFKARCGVWILDACHSSSGVERHFLSAAVSLPCSAPATGSRARVDQRASEMIPRPTGATAPSDAPIL